MDKNPKTESERERNKSTVEASIAYTVFSVGLPIAVDMLTAGADCAFKAMGEQPQSDRWGDGLIWVGNQLAREGKTNGVRIMLDALAKNPVRDEGEVQRVIAELERSIASPGLGD